MSRRGDIEIMYDIREACERIGRYTDGIDYDEFVVNTLLQDSVIKKFHAEFFNPIFNLIIFTLNDKFFSRSSPWSCERNENFLPIFQQLRTC